MIFMRTAYFVDYSMAVSPLAAALFVSRPTYSPGGSRFTIQLQALSAILTTPEDHRSVWRTLNIIISPAVQLDDSVHGMHAKAVGFTDCHRPQQHINTRQATRRGLSRFEKGSHLMPAMSYDGKFAQSWPSSGRIILTCLTVSTAAADDVTPTVRADGGTGPAK